MIAGNGGYGPGIGTGQSGENLDPKMRENTSKNYEFCMNEALRRAF